MAGIGAGITANYRRAPGKDMSEHEGRESEDYEREEEDREDDEDEDEDEGDEDMEEGQGMTQASPEEQAAYEQFLRNAIELTHGPDGKPTEPVQRHLQGEFEPEVMQMFQAVNPPINPESPSDRLALTGLLVVMATDASAMSAGKDVGNDVVLHAGVELIAMFAEDAEALGLFESDEKGIEVAVTRAVDIYNQIDGPRVDKQMLADEFQQLMEADKAGQLDKVLPGAKQAAGMADQQQGAMA